MNHEDFNIIKTEIKIKSQLLFIKIHVVFKTFNFRNLKVQYIF